MPSAIQSCRSDKISPSPTSKPTWGLRSAAGAVYTFDGTTGQHLLTFHDPNPSLSNYFGSSIQTVNGKLLISSGSDSSNYAGTVYAYDPTSGQLANTIPNPNGTSGFGFGFDMEQRQSSVFISAIGAPISGVDAGAVYRYDGTNFGEALKISAPTPEANEFFGWSMAQNSTQLLVGAPNYSSSANVQVGQAYLFNPDTGAIANVQ